MDGKTNLKTKTNLIDQNENFQTLETKIKITPNLRNRNIIYSKIYLDKICDFFVKFEESTKRSTILVQGMYAKVFFFFCWRIICKRIMVIKVNVHCKSNVSSFVLLIKIYSGIYFSYEIREHCSKCIDHSFKNQT